MGLSHGIGAAIAAPGRKTVAMCGDGGFFLNIAEILTATQEKADVMFLVMNDKGYGVIKHIQDALQGGRNYYADFKNPELSDVAKLAGMTYAKVSRADELGDVVAKTIKTPGPSLVEVDMAAIGPFPSYFAEQVKLGRKH
jgi:acetolactate synthase-1/2/3 large subunit